MKLNELNGSTEKVQISCDKSVLYFYKIPSAIFFLVGLWVIYKLVNEPFEVTTIIALVGLLFVVFALLRFLLFGKFMIWVLLLLLLFPILLLIWFSFWILIMDGCRSHKSSRTSYYWFGEIIKAIDWWMQELPDPCRKS